MRRLFYVDELGCYRAVVEAPWRSVGHWLQRDVGCLRYYISFLQEVIDSISVGDLSSWNGRTATFGLHCTPTHAMLTRPDGRLCALPLMEFREIITAWKTFVSRREPSAEWFDPQAYLRLPSSLC